MATSSEAIEHRRESITSLASVSDISTASLSSDPSSSRRSSAPAGHRASSENAAHSYTNEHGESFTVRGLLAGLFIGILICFTNIYLGLQTGWISTLTLPSSLLGFGIFKAASRLLSRPFLPAENVLVQTVAGALGTMPLTAGLIGVIPALEYLLRPDEGAPVDLKLGRLIVWALGVGFFGVVFAVPLRKEVIIREKLRFPSGTGTALMIAVLHGDKDFEAEPKGTQADSSHRESREASVQSRPIVKRKTSRRSVIQEEDARNAWKAQIKLLGYCFLFSAAFTLLSYFVPILHSLPFLGTSISHQWLWSFTPSPAYIGQGIIMGPATTFHMLLGAVIGYGILSPLAKSYGWAPGPISDWETGSKGWIIWVSLAIMLVDSVISLATVVGQPLVYYLKVYSSELFARLKRFKQRGVSGFQGAEPQYTAVPTDPTPSFPEIANSQEHPRLRYQVSSSQRISRTVSSSLLEPEIDAPTSQLVSVRTVLVGLTVSLILCVLSTHFIFGSSIPIPLVFLSLLLALILSVVGVRALGETDLNPVSGISKVTQLLFATIITGSNPHAVVVNLVAGAIAEAGAMQAGELMQDLKTGHLIGASPKAQFYGQIIGTAVGAFVSPAIYKLYTRVYQIPGEAFPVPTAPVWIFTARLVLGKGLPPMVGWFALAAGGVWSLLTLLRVNAQKNGRWWLPWIPGGIAVAVGMFNVPSFTLARTLGGIINWYWLSRRRAEETPLIIVASGLILGEGILSIVTLVFAGLGVPHL